MPIRPLFEWSQTNGEIHLQVYFKSGVKREGVDVFLTDTFMKINASPTYLLHIDLLYEILPEESRYYFDPEKTGVLHIHGKKAQTGKEWERLTVNAEKAPAKTSSPLITELPPSSSSPDPISVEASAPSPATSPSFPLLTLPDVLMSKKDVLARRQKSLLRAEQKYNEMLEKRKQQREAEGRRLTAAQWDVEKEKRQTIERRMRTEKEAEEAELYAWEDRLAEEKKEKITDPKTIRADVKSPADLLSAFLHPPEEKEVTKRVEDETTAMLQTGGTTTSNEAPPGVRQHDTVRVGITFTPKTLALPTRSRGDEEYYRQSRYKPVNIEDSPMFWKEKGDVFYKNHEYASAADAYGESIKRDGVFLTCVMNRAACYLQLMEYEKCIKDVSLALNMLANTPSSDLSQDRYRFLMCKLHARRGAAFVWSDDLRRGLQDYRMAAAYANSETDTKTGKDLQMIEELMKKRNIRMEDEEDDEKDEEGAAAVVENPDGVASSSSSTGSSPLERETSTSGGSTSAVTTTPTAAAGGGGGDSSRGGIPFARTRAYREKIQASTTAFYKGDYAEASKLYLEILEKDPLNGPARSNLVVVRLVEKNFDAALTECHTIMTQCQEVAQALQRSDPNGGEEDGLGGDSDDEEEEEEEDDDVEEAKGGGADGKEEEEHEEKETRESTKARRAANRDLLVMERRAAVKRVKESTNHVYLLLKAYVRGAAALCGKQHYHAAHQYLQSALRITPYDNDLMEDMLRLEEKIRMDTLISASTGGMKRKETHTPHSDSDPHHTNQ